jgi:hypothetical protein
MNLIQSIKSLPSKLPLPPRPKRPHRHSRHLIHSPSSPPPSSTRTHPFSKKLLLLLYAILAIVIAFTAYQIPFQLPTPQITCQSQYGPCPENLQNFLRQSQHQSLINSLIHLPNNLQNQFPNIQVQGWQFTFPDQLQIHLLLPKATFALAAVSETGQPDPHFSQLVLVDPHGQIVALAPDSSLPQISVTQLAWNHQHLLLPHFQKGTHIAQALLDQGYRYQHARMDSQSLTVSLSPSKNTNHPVTILFPLNGNTADQLVTALHLVLTRSTISPDEISQIDLRYSKPIIR